MKLSELKSLQGHKRVLLLQSKDAVHLHNQRELFDRAPKEYESRDLIIVSGLEDDIIEHYDMSNDFDLVLIGKDGGVKYRAHGVADPDKIYTLIDQMPLRRREMEAGQ